MKKSMISNPKGLNQTGYIPGSIMLKVSSTNRVSILRKPTAA